MSSSLGGRRLHMSSEAAYTSILRATVGGTVMLGDTQLLAPWVIGCSAVSSSRAVLEVVEEPLLFPLCAWSTWETRLMRNWRRMLAFGHPVQIPPLGSCTTYTSILSVTPVREGAVEVRSLSTDSTAVTSHPMPQTHHALETSGPARRQETQDVSPVSWMHFVLKRRHLSHIP